ncbi:MAG: MFS transporter [Chloroflexota bacterium]|nr:MFS transporter [Chloroflexota bacterium]
MRSSDPYRVYLIFSGATSLLFALIFTIMAVYRVQAAGLNPLQLVLVGTALEVTYFCFNLPTGVVADTYSRKLSVVIGVLLFGAGFVLEGSFPIFGAIILAQVIEGFGYTFMEGALEAWITDEVGEANVGAVFLRGSQVANITGLVGIGGSVALASIGLALPIIVGGVLFLALAVWLMLAMTEPAFVRRPRSERESLEGKMASSVRNSLRDMAGTLRQSAHVVRRRPLALTILAIAGVWGGFTEGLDRLGEAHFIQVIGLPRIGNFDTVVWFGIIAAGGMLLTIGASELARRRLALEQSTVAVRALFAFNSVLIVSMFVFALAGSFALALGAFWVVSVMRSLQYPVYSTWLNQNVDPRVRATVLSMSGQTDALGQFTVGPGIGVLGTVYGLRVALSAAAAALSPALLLYGYALRKHRTAPAPPPTPAVTAES